MKRQYKIGDYVMVVDAHDQRAYGRIAVVERLREEYPQQKWYEVRYLKPVDNALFADEFYRNATHGTYTERDLCAVQEA